MEKEQEKAAKAREAALQGALTQIERSSAGSIMKMGTRGPRSGVAAVPTGALSLDLALGIGGMPRGRIEVFGPESSGKTTPVYHVIARRSSRRCAFIDAEHAMDPLYAQRLGVNIDELLVSQPDYGEQGLEIADMLVRSGAVDVVAIDSVAALTPRAELEGQMGDQTVGVQARMMSQAMRKLAGNLNRTQTLCPFVNQIREKVGVMFGCCLQYRRPRGARGRQHRDDREDRQPAHAGRGHVDGPRDRRDLALADRRVLQQRLDRQLLGLRSSREASAADASSPAPRTT